MLRIEARWSNTNILRVFKVLHYYFLKALRNIKESCTIKEIYRRLQAM